MLLDNITEKTLDNGLKVIALRKPGAAIAAVQLWYRTGSIRESDGIRGISHVLEHMMFRGSSSVKSEEHMQKINEVGGHCNAFTTEDVTVFTDNVPRPFFEMVLELEADRMDGLTLDPVLFETERQVIIEEYHTQMNNPVAKAFLEFRREFFRGHPYALSPIGTIEDLNTMRVEQLREYYSRFYSPDNAVLVVVGDIEANMVLNLARRYFGDKKPRRSGVGGKPGERLNGMEHCVESTNYMRKRVEFDVPLLIVGYPGPASSHEDAVALEILQLVMSGGESGRLHREVVRRQSAAVMVGGMNHLLEHAGISMFFAAFTPDVPAARVERALEEQIEEVRNMGISVREMEKVRNATLANRTFELYTAEHICQRIGYGECIEGDYRLWVERLEALKKLDTSLLVDVARRYWSDAHRHVLHLQPKRTNPLLYVAGIMGRISGKFGRGRGR